MSIYLSTSNNKVSYTLIFLFILAGFHCNAQNRFISPYSQYGIGELNNNSLSRNLGISGIGYGYRKNTAVNYLNPASYSVVDSTSFVFEVVGFSHFYEQKTSTQEQMSNYSSLGNIGFSFPLSGNLAVGGGLKPYSSVGYKVANRTSEDKGTIDYIYEGSGGINEVFLGTAYELFNELSLGINASYLFGNIEDKITISPVDIPGFNETYKIEKDQIKGFLFNFGLQYSKNVSEERYYTLGLTYGHNTDLNISRSELIQQEMPGTPTPPNIVKPEGTADEGKLSIPKNIGLGSWFKYNESWSGGIDINWQNWEDFQRLGQSEELQDSYNLALGLKFSPKSTTYSNVFIETDYLAGVRYGQSYLNIGNQSFDEFGVSFGIHMPIRRTNNGINIGFEYSQRGTIEENNIQEDFYKINVGFNIYERWFVKRKFY